MITDPPTRRSRRKLFLFVTAATLLAGAAWYARTHVSLEGLVRQEDLIRTHIALFPWSSFLLGFVVYAVLSMIPGTGGKAIAFGWLYGFWQAMVLVTLGLTTAAMVIFSLSRYFFRERIERRYDRVLTLLNKHLEQEGAFYLLTLRMAHAPFSIINPISGASRVRTWTFLWTTMVGLLPGVAIWVYVGIRLPSLRELATHGPGFLLDPPLIGALVACATLPLLVRWIVSHFGIPGVGSANHDATTT